jgi:hypothetical protein
MQVEARKAPGGDGNVGREIIGDCSEDPELGEYETELIIKYLKQTCGEPPAGVDIQVTWEGCEVGCDEAQYPVISIVWDDCAVEYPDDYIEKCSAAFERFDLPQETYDLYQAIIDLQNGIQKLPES